MPHRDVASLARAIRTNQLPSARQWLVLVVMITIGSMPMSVVGVVHVVAVRYRVVTTARPMFVTVGGVSQVRKWMLIVMAIMRRMSVPFVHVVDMSLALGACVSAPGPVYVVVIVSVVLGGCHLSSLL